LVLVLELALALALALAPMLKLVPVLILVLVLILVQACLVWMIVEKALILQWVGEVRRGGGTAQSRNSMSEVVLRLVLSKLEHRHP
jgi:hypothetical protein